MSIKPLTGTAKRLVAATATAAILATGVPLAGPVAAAPPSAPSAAQGTSTFPGNDHAPHKVTWDGHSFLVDGARLNVFSGEFHYWRLPAPEQWRDILQKIKASGFNAVSLYAFWGYHSDAPGQFDFSGIRDIDLLLTMAEQEGLYVIARPGPYINAEVSMGGLPAYMTNSPNGLRTTQPDNLAASKEWLHAFDQIAKKHQVTDGGGSILMYQVENELLTESTDRAAFEAELIKEVKADGITVPLFHNDYNLNRQFVPKAAGGTGAGADIGLDVYAYDDYPLGFTCSNPRAPIRDRESAFRAAVSDNPIFVSEAQGGAFTPWGAAFTPEKCAEFTDPAFVRQWGVNNIGSGVTAFNYYMSFGGTNWGFTGSPSSGFTSYDYGAAISEDRQIGAKLSAQKQIGYYLDSVPQVASMQRIQPPAPDSGAASVYPLVRQATENLDQSATGTGTQYVGFRQADSNATTDASFTFPLALGKGVPVKPASFTTDDADLAAIAYAGAWTHATGQSWTANDYKGTESFSNTVGDKVSYTFTGTAIQVVMPQSENHGYGDVYIDGVKVGQTDSYRAPQNQTKQWVAFEKSGLAAGQHTISVVVTGHKDAASSGTFVSVDAFNVPSGDSGTAAPPPVVSFPRVPQKAGTALTLHGRDALSVTADLKLGEHELYYTTSEIQHYGSTAGSDVLLLSGYPGDPGETVLHLPAKPKVDAVGGPVEQTWDEATKTLRLNYVHGEDAVATVKADGQPTLRVMVTDRNAMEKTWRIDGAKDGANRTTLVQGADLVRSVRYEGSVAHLSGSMSAAGRIVVTLPAGVTKATWNGVGLPAPNPGTPGLIVGDVPGPAAVSLPALAFKSSAEAPESAKDYDVSAWTKADKTSTLSSQQGPSGGIVLDSNAYGAYEGDVWYRASYTAASGLSQITLRGNGSTGSPANPILNAAGGTAADMLVWVNGQYAGAKPANGRDQTFAVPAGAATAGAPVAVAVLVKNLGQNLDWSDDGLSRQNRGLYSAKLGNAGPIDWRIQGALGGGTAVDRERGLYNNGGLYGERAGWHLPGYPSDSWAPAADLHNAAPGVTWYRSSFDLAIPDGQDTALALQVTSSKFSLASRTDPSRMQIFVNGWNIGLYAGNVGPQSRFTIPTGVLNQNGHNEIALAVTAETAGAGPDSVSLVNRGSMTGGVRVPQNQAPAFALPESVTAAGNGPVGGGEQAVVSGAFTLPALEAGLRAEALVDWGDGTTSASPAASSAYTAKHSYRAAGNYTVKVELRDSVGGAVLGTTSTSVEVTGGTVP